MALIKILVRKQKIVFILSKLLCRNIMLVPHCQSIKYHCR